VPAIIERDEFEAVQSMLKVRNTKGDAVTAAA